jgi:hypothetical protein
MSGDVEALLWEIADCAELRRCRAGSDPEHPCQAIVAVQAEEPWERHQRPEPWNGALATAPILFVSSNPSIDRTEPYPTGAADRQAVSSFFNRRFDDHIVGGTRPRKVGGVPAARPVPYLNEVMRIASSLLGRAANPGSDYAITEVVHCKSAGRRGLERRGGRPGALQLCPSLYLRRIVDLSGARLVVAVGSDARRQFGRELGLPGDFGLLAHGHRPLVRMASSPDDRYYLAVGGISSSERRNVMDDRVLSAADRRFLRNLLA